jgi:hypothetical protein
LASLEIYATTLVETSCIVNAVVEPPHSDGSPAGTPRWVKVFGVIAAVMVVVFIVLLLFGGGHGPGRHGGSAGAESPAGHTGPPLGFDHVENQP